MTRVRFPLSVDKVRWLFSKASKGSPQQQFSQIWEPAKDSHSNQIIISYYNLNPAKTRMSEWLRRQIQDLLRKLMGSNPIPRIQFGSSVKRTWWRRGAGA